MQAVIGTTPVPIATDQYVDVGAAGQVVVVQNLGPGDLYIDFLEGVDSSSGLKLAAGGDAYEFPRATSQTLYAVATEADTDVRIMVVG